MKVELNIGDIVVDLVTGEAGILVSRYLLAGDTATDPLALWAWDIYWIGKNIERNSRLQPWTEYGLINVIKAGTFMQYKSN